MLEERLDDDIPNILVTFPDGYTDTLKLKHFFPKEERREGRCHFIGHLEREEEACVGLAGCIGSEDAELTFMSEHAPGSGMYIWKKDGSIEAMPSPFEVSIYHGVYIHMKGTKFKKLCFHCIKSLINTNVSKFTFRMVLMMLLTQQ